MSARSLRLAPKHNESRDEECSEHIHYGSILQQKAIKSNPLPFIKKPKECEEEDDSLSKYPSLSPHPRGLSILVSPADSQDDCDFMVEVRSRDESSKNETPLRIDEPASIESEEAPVSSPQLASPSEAIALPPSPVIEKSTVCPVALPNLGNTCYMNSVLQSIFTLKEFRDTLCKVIKNCGYACRPSENDTLDGSQKEASENDSALKLTSQLVSTWNSYERERERDAFQLQEVDVNDVLGNFKSAVGNYNDQFHSNSQQDAVEFVELILDTMTDEFKKIKDNLEDKSGDFINPLQLFKIELKTQSSCTSCGHVTRLPNIISNTLYLNIPSGHEEGTLALQDVVDSYFTANGKTEQNCDQNGCSGSEKLLLTSVGSLPKYLAVQLGRYTMVGEKIHTKIALHPNIWLPNPQKDESEVSCHPACAFEQTCIEPAIISNNRPLIPTLGGSSPFKKAPSLVDSIDKTNALPLICSLDSPPATPPVVTSSTNSVPPSPVTACLSPKTPSSPVSSSPISRTEGVEYTLSAVICHRGSTRDMGHYYAFVRNSKDDNWYSCDDDTVKCLPFDEVVSASRSRCYCFFFEQAS